MHRDVRALVETVAAARHCADQVGEVTELHAKAADSYVDRPVVDFGAVRVDPFDGDAAQGFSRNRSAGMRDQTLKQRELLKGEADIPIADEDAMPREVNDDIALQQRIGND